MRSVSSASSGSAISLSRVSEALAGVVRDVLGSPDVLELLGRVLERLDSFGEVGGVRLGEGVLELLRPQPQNSSTDTLSLSPLLSPPASSPSSPPHDTSPGAAGGRRPRAGPASWGFTLPAPVPAVQRRLEPPEVRRPRHLDRAEAWPGAGSPTARPAAVRPRRRRSSARPARPAPPSTRRSPGGTSTPPANSPPIATPYRPPASRPSRHASTECTQPSSCSRSTPRRCRRRSSRRPGAGRRTRRAPPRTRCRPGSRSRQPSGAATATPAPVGGSTPRADRATTRPSAAGVRTASGTSPPVGRQHRARARGRPRRRPGRRRRPVRSGPGTTHGSVAARRAWRAPTPRLGRRL